MLGADFERVRVLLPTLEYRAAAALLREAKARVGPRPPTLHFPQDKIEHMVVLFVENRASDHVWGCMLGDRRGFDGIPSNSTAAKDNETGCGTAQHVCTHGVGPHTKFSASQLPVKAAIAEHYGVHNRMFTAFPGSSWPNHLFAQSATSCGISANVMYNKCGGTVPQFPQMTIYDSLALADVPFGIYVNMTCGPNDPANSTAESCAEVHPGWGVFNGSNSNGLDPDVTMAGVARHSDRFFSHDLFYKQAAEGTLPAFSWISPPHEAADHPCMDMAKGERLLKDIYEALRAGKGWDKTLFMVTYDDFGGFDDQVPLPDAVQDHSPCLVWNKQHHVSINATTNCAHRSSNFSKLGHRGVSAMMSPWVGKQAIFQQPMAAPPLASQPPRQYDHTSILATAKSFFTLGGFLTERDAWAGTFDELLLDVPRQQGDMPMHLPDAPEPAEPWLPWGPLGPPHCDPPGSVHCQYPKCSAVGTQANCTAQFPRCVWRDERCASVQPRPPAPPAPAPPAPLPRGKKWRCYNGTRVGPPARGVPSLNLSGVDYKHGLNGLASCEKKCNGCYRYAGSEAGGCLALEYEFEIKRCVCYSGVSLDEAAFASVLTKEKPGTWSSCMLVDEARRRHLEPAPLSSAGIASATAAAAAAAAATPQHCSSQIVGEGACLGAHAVTQKQRSLLELYSALTHTPMPDIDSMGHAEAEAWNRVRYSEYLSMIR
jgi:phospholipase C